MPLRKDQTKGNRVQLLRRTAGVAALALVCGQASFAQDAVEVAKVGPDQMAFSVTNMDSTVAPGVDFYRYAAGGWLSRVQRPERFASYGFFEIMADHVQQQMKEVLAQASQGASTAKVGSPAQQVGTFYNAYMNTAARDAAGVAPLKPYLDRIDAVKDYDELVRLIAEMERGGGPSLFALLLPDVDLADNSAYVIYAEGGRLGLPASFEDVYDEPEGGARITAYRTYLIEMQKIAGQSEAEAARIADLSIKIERKLHAAKLKPAEKVDIRAIYNPMTIDELQAQIPQLDLRLLLGTLDFAAPDQVIVTEPRYFPALSALLNDISMQDIRDYAKLRTLQAFQPFLTTAFDPPLIGLNQALLGVGILPPMEERAMDTIKAELGQPISQLYVENFFTDEARQKAVEMIGLIKAAFQERMPSRDWLSDETRAAAVEKLAALSFWVGYPDEWIDYSQVPITDDLVASVSAIATFNFNRLHDKVGKPVVIDHFNTDDSYPMVVNAGYNPALNGFEVPAAITQAPVFDAKMDAAVNFCRMGAVLGHEMTHGFDLSGKSFDAKGNLKNWWTPADEAAFMERAQGLINQANAYEVMPGVTGNGPLEVGENMADLGGITLAHQALQTYLAAHPEENVLIDGLTPDQRCFLAWSQLWAWQGVDEVLRSAAATDHHPPNVYRAVAPLLHVDAFYEAFGIKEGDPMWLPPEQRVHAW